MDAEKTPLARTSALIASRRFARCQLLVAASPLGTGRSQRRPQ